MTRYPLIDKPAPPLSLPDANGQTYTLDPRTVGRPVVLFFYPQSGASHGLSCSGAVPADTTRCTCAQARSAAHARRARSATHS